MNNILSKKLKILKRKDIKLSNLVELCKDLSNINKNKGLDSYL